MASGILNGSEDRPDKEQVASESPRVFHRGGGSVSLSVHMAEETPPHCLSQDRIPGTSSMICLPSVEGSQEPFQNR